MKIGTKIGLALAVLLFTASCSPGLGRDNPVPEPNPDHGPPVASALQNTAVYLRWQILDVNDQPAGRNVTFTIVYLTAGSVPLTTVDPDTYQPVPPFTSRSPAAYIELGFKNPIAIFVEVTAMFLGRPGDSIEFEVTRDPEGMRGWLEVAGPMFLDIPPDASGPIHTRTTTMVILRPPM